MAEDCVEEVGSDLVIFFDDSNRSSGAQRHQQMHTISNMEIRKRSENGVILHDIHPCHRTSAQQSARIKKQHHHNDKQRIHLTQTHQKHKKSKQVEAGMRKQRDNGITQYDNPPCTHTPIVPQKKLRNSITMNLDQTEPLVDHQFVNLNLPKQSVQRMKNMHKNKKKFFPEYVGPTEAHGVTDDMGQIFPSVKSEKKWRQNIRTSISVLDDSNVDFMTSGNKKRF